MADTGVWVKVHPDDAGGGAAVINDAASNYDSKDAGVEIDGKTYDIYTFTTATTTRSVRLTDEAQSRITDEDLLMAVATTPIPDDFTGDPATLFDEKYRNQLRNAFEIAPAVDPGLTLTVDTPGFAGVLVVGGGGGGGHGQCGGGGAGQFFEYLSYIDAGVLPVTVGSGGSGMASSASPGTNGSQSGFNLYWAVGGGEAKNRSEGGNGGSGAGTGDTNPDGFGVTIAGGQNGGRGGSQCGGGGGGALLPGQDGSNSSTRKGGDGGDGIVSTITGTEVTLAGGGGGHGTFDVGKGGAGGGGDGTTGAGGNGAANTGSGGGSGPNRGGDGGSGIVIVRVQV